MIRLAALLAFFAAPAIAQSSNCAPYSILVSGLAESYGETRQTIGLSRRGVVEIYANLETGTWSAIVTAPSGMSCMVAEGKSFEVVSEPSKGDPT